MSTEKDDVLLSEYTSTLNQDVGVTKGKIEENFDIDNGNQEIGIVNVNKRDSSIEMGKGILSTLDVSSEKGAIISGIAATFGTGVLTFPSMIEKVGLIPGIIIYVIVSFATLFSLILLVNSSLSAKIFNYSILTQKCLGMTWFFIYNLSAIIFYFGVIMTYQFMAYKFLGNVFKMNPEEAKKNPVKIHTFYISLCVIGAIVQTILSLLKNIRKSNLSSAIAAITLFLTILISVCESPLFVKEARKNNYTIEWFNTKIPDNDYNKDYTKLELIMNYIECYIIFMFGFLNHSGVLQAMGNLHVQTENKCFRILYISFIIEFIGYTLFGFVGYISQKKNIDQCFINKEYIDSSFNNLHFGLTIVSKLLFFVCLNCLIPVRWSIIHECYTSILIKYQINKNLEILLTFLAFLIMNTFVYFCTDVKSMIALFSGIFGVMLVFFIPLFIFISIYGPKRMRSIIGMILFVISLIIGSSSTLYYLYKDFSSLFSKKK